MLTLALPSVLPPKTAVRSRKGLLSLGSPLLVAASPKMAMGPKCRSVAFPSSTPPVLPAVVSACLPNWLLLSLQMRLLLRELPPRLWPRGSDPR